MTISYDDYLAFVNITQNMNAVDIKDETENTFRAYTGFHKVVSQMMKQSMTEDQFKNILNPTFKTYKALYPKMTTLNVKLSQVRKVIKENQSNDFYLISNTPIFSITKDELNTIHSNYEKKVEAKNNERITINKDYLLERIEYLKRNHSNIYDLGALLLIVSGMRPIELFVNKVKRITSKPQYVKISNIAKKKDKEFTVERPIISMTAERFLKLLFDFKNYFNGMTTINDIGVLATDKSKGLNTSVKNTFSEITGRQGASIMRKYYALLSYSIYADKNKQEYQHWIKNILGHESLVETFSYSYYKLETDAPEQKEAPAIKTYVKSTRTTPKPTRTALLEEIYNDYHGDISVRTMKDLSGVGTTAISAFLKSKRI